MRRTILICCSIPRRGCRKRAAPGACRMRTGLRESWPNARSRLRRLLRGRHAGARLRIVDWQPRVVRGREFHFSWSLYDPSGRAIKTVYAGDDWRDAVFAAKVDAAAAAAVLGRTPKALCAGATARFAPDAIHEMTSLLGWSGFSARAVASARSPLHRLYAERGRARSARVDHRGFLAGHRAGVQRGRLPARQRAARRRRAGRRAVCARTARDTGARRMARTTPKRRSRCRSRAARSPMPTCWPRSTRFYVGNPGT